MENAKHESPLPIQANAGAAGRVILSLAARLATRHAARQLTRFSLTMRLAKYLIDAGHSDDSLVRQARIDRERERGRLLYRDWQVTANDSGTIFVGVAPMWLADP